MKVRIKRENMHRNALVLAEAPVRIESSVMMKGFIGAYTYARAGSRLGAGLLSIGRYCSIAPGAVIADGQHPTDWLTCHTFYKGDPFWVGEDAPIFTPRNPPMRKRTIIGNDVWIGANAIIMSGVTVGDGAIVGAGAVITKDVEPFSVVAGIPARAIKKRFSSETEGAIARAAWWNYTARSLLNVPLDQVDEAIIALSENDAEPIKPVIFTATASAIKGASDEEQTKAIRRYQSSNKATALILPEPPQS